MKVFILVDKNQGNRIFGVFDNKHRAHEYITDLLRSPHCNMMRQDVDIQEWEVSTLTEYETYKVKG